MLNRGTRQNRLIRAGVVRYEDAKDNSGLETAKRRLGRHAQNPRAFRRLRVGGLKADTSGNQRASQLAGPGADFEDRAISREPAQGLREGVHQLPTDSQEAPRVVTLIEPACASLSDDQTLTPPSEARQRVFTDFQPATCRYC